MKRFMMLILALVGFEYCALAQDWVKEPKLPIMKYGYYSPGDALALATGSSEKSHEFAVSTLQLVNRKLQENGFKKVFSSIFEIFDLVSSEQEVRLNAEEFKNSRWLPDQKKIEFYQSGAGFEGNAGIFSYTEGDKKISFPLYKDSCLNLLDAKITITSAKTFADKGSDSVATKKKVYLVDTIGKGIYVLDTVIYKTTYDDYYYYGNGISYTYYPYAQPMFYADWYGWQWSFYPCWGNFFHEHQCFVENNNYTTIINFNNTNYGQPVTPPGHTENNDRVTPPGHDDPYGRITPPGHDGFYGKVTNGGYDVNQRMVQGGHNTSQQAIRDKHSSYSRAVNNGEVANRERIANNNRKLNNERVNPANRSFSRTQPAREQTQMRERPQTERRISSLPVERNNYQPQRTVQRTQMQQPGRTFSQPYQRQGNYQRTAQPQKQTRTVGPRSTVSSGNKTSFGSATRGSVRSH